MRNCIAKNRKSKAIINDVEITDDVLTSRAGLTLFARYLRSIGLLPYMEAMFAKIRKSRKGREISEIFKQLFCFFIDGTSRHLVHFDTLKEDEGYRSSIESEPDDMLSSHAVKRFFMAMLIPWGFMFRKVLQKFLPWTKLLQNLQVSRKCCRSCVGGQHFLLLSYMDKKSTKTN